MDYDADSRSRQLTSTHPQPIANPLQLRRWLRLLVFLFRRLCQVKYRNIVFDSRLIGMWQMTKRCRNDRFGLRSILSQLTLVECLTGNGYLADRKRLGTRTV
jgi:hypothetical protein